MESQKRPHEDILDEENDGDGPSSPPAKAPRLAIEYVLVRLYWSRCRLTLSVLSILLLQ